MGGSGITVEPGPTYIGCCEYCGMDIYDDMEHYEMPDDTLYCSSECLVNDMDQYYRYGVID